MGEYLESPEIWRLNSTNAFSQWLAGDRKPHMSVGRVKWSGMKCVGSAIWTVMSAGCPPTSAKPVQAFPHLRSQIMTRLDKPEQISQHCLRFSSEANGFSRKKGVLFSFTNTHQITVSLQILASNSYVLSYNTDSLSAGCQSNWHGGSSTKSET